ncbi:MAG TPA: pyridoxamine 5'-phosphate oxidase family protein [Rhizomicrobium sp.]
MPEKNQVLALMDAAEAVYLATIGEKGPRIRALVNLRRRDLYPGPSKTCRTDDFTAFLSTSMASTKVRDIRANPAVALYYCAPNQFHGVMLSGKMEILTDTELKYALWSDDWRIYWPTGTDDPDYAVLRLKADEVTGWWGSTPFRIALT